MEKGYIYLEEKLAENTIKYIRLITHSDRVEYIDCTLENGKVTDFNERIADLEIVKSLVNSPNIKGSTPVVFHGNMGISIRTD